MDSLTLARTLGGISLENSHLGQDVVDLFNEVTGRVGTGEEFDTSITGFDLAEKIESLPAYMQEKLLKKNFDLKKAEIEEKKEKQTESDSEKKAKALRPYIGMALAVILGLTVLVLAFSALWAAHSGNPGPDMSTLDKIAVAIVEILSHFMSSDAQ